MSKNEKGTCKQMLLTPSNEKFGSGDSSKYWVLGDIFLQNYYSIYDLPKGKVGLIESRAGAAGESSSSAPAQSQAQVSENWNQMYGAMTEDTSSEM